MKCINRLLLGSFVAVITAATGMSSWAGSGCCDRCGCGESHRVCRLKCTYKEVEVVCWSSKCEDFCVPGPCPLSCRGGHDGRGCSSCDGGCTGTGAGRCAAPKSARIRTKKLLLKKVVKKKVPVYEWVIEDLCASCDAKVETPTVPPTAVIPKPPAVDAVFHYGKRAVTPVRLQLSDAGSGKPSGTVAARFDRRPE